MPNEKLTGAVTLSIVSDIERAGKHMTTIEKAYERVMDYRITASHSDMRVSQWTEPPNIGRDASGGTSPGERFDTPDLTREK